MHSNEKVKTSSLLTWKKKKKKKFSQPEPEPRFHPMYMYEYLPSEPSAFLTPGYWTCRYILYKASVDDNQLLHQVLMRDGGNRQEN